MSDALHFVGLAMQIACGAPIGVGVALMGKTKLVREGVALIFGPMMMWLVLQAVWGRP